MKKELLQKDEIVKKEAQKAEYEKILRLQAEEKLQKYKKEDQNLFKQVDSSLQQMESGKSL